MSDSNSDSEPELERQKISVPARRRLSFTVPEPPPAKRVTRIKNKIAMGYTTEEKSYFHELSSEQQDDILLLEDLMGEYAKANSSPLRFRILKSNMDIVTKHIVLSKLNHFQNIKEYNGEYYKLKQWFDALCRLPFGKTLSLPVSADRTSKADICTFFQKCRSTLDASVFGHSETKCHILRIIAQWISNPSCKGHAIGIVGPMGTGKTSLVKHGICQSLGLPFSFISLGGCNDSAFLCGHGVTYEGSTYGKIAESLMKTQCMNPVLFFDELDKISDTNKGDEIANILVHLTDTTQNDTFNDHYFGDIHIDVSRALFIFSFNDESKINPILKDRMTIIRVQGYTTDDKIQIAQRHLIPELCQQYSLLLQPDAFSEDIIRLIISKVENEHGVRNLKRHIETIISWINILQYTDPKLEDYLPSGKVTEKFVQKYLRCDVNASTCSHMHSYYT